MPSPYSFLFVFLLTSILSIVSEFEKGVGEMPQQVGRAPHWTCSGPQLDSQYWYPADHNLLTLVPGGLSTISNLTMGNFTHICTPTPNTYSSWKRKWVFKDLEVWWDGSVTALAWDLDLVPSTHVVSHTCPWLRLQGIWYPSLSASVGSHVNSYKPRHIKETNPRREDEA